MNATPNAPTALGPPIAILGVPFDNVTTADTLRLIGEMIASRQPHYLATANVDFVVQAQTDPELRRILCDAHLVVADGMPLVWASRWLGNPLPERVTGSGLTPQLLALAAEQGWRVFFLGGTELSVEQARVNTLAKHPKLQLGAYSPPFGRLVDAKTDDPMNHAEIQRRLREARPDILLVAFGCPKQERWIYAHYRSLGVPVSIGVGATIDFLAGTMRRAPVWMQKTGLEWIFRMLQEPRRLFRRYAVDLWVFGWAILGQLRQLRAGRAQRRLAAGTPSAPVKTASAWRVTLPARLDAAFTTANEAAWQQLLAQPAHLLVDAAVEFVDSTGVALLLRLQKGLREGRFQLVLVAASPALIQALQLMKLAEFFLQAPDQTAALKLTGGQGCGGAVLMNLDLAAQPVHLVWQGEVTAANLREIEARTSSRLRQARDPIFMIDLTELRFIDTSGIGLMVKLQKQAARQGVQLRFTAPSATIRQIVSHLRMEEYLFGAPA
jgi:N-acetylglucosaminyldiphosphoundecaprenol N-acetyl-beta-D-mannosaminyltransferase